MEQIEKASRLLRFLSLEITTKAGSGHPTSCLSAADLMSVLFFDNVLKYDTLDPKSLFNDSIIFSKGHASALFYALWYIAGVISYEELITYREFGSPLEGHPSIEFDHTLFPTGSLGQGLSIGLGTALSSQLDNLNNHTFVLLGDAEMSEGSNWEAIELASHYRINNLIGIIDINGLGQRGETMLGYSLEDYRKRISSFGWNVLEVDGHNLIEIKKAYDQALVSNFPTMILAKTVKGKGVSFLENKNNWHGKALSQEEFEMAKEELGYADLNFHLEITKPQIDFTNKSPLAFENNKKTFEIGENVATRKAYGQGLVNIFEKYPEIIAIDGETDNSTYANVFGEKFSDNFLEMEIAEENMVGVAGGLSVKGKIPFVSTFTAFFTRSFDQIRMSGYANANIKFVGSHGGVSIGQDGPSQMGLEDIGMFRSVWGSSVLYPSDANSCLKLIEQMAANSGLFYLRTTRMDTPVIYSKDEQFSIGGSKVLKETTSDRLTLVAAGITLHESLKAYDQLEKEGIKIRVIDLYSIKPIDAQTLKKALDETGIILTVEDHYGPGGIGEAVKAALEGENGKIFSLCVSKKPKSGKPEELLDYEEISSEKIAQGVKRILHF